jgi:hypothetical protein
MVYGHPSHGNILLTMPHISLDDPRGIDHGEKPQTMNTKKAV